MSNEYCNCELCRGWRNEEMAYIYYDTKNKVIEATRDGASGYSFFKHYSYNTYCATKKELDEYLETGYLSNEAKNYLGIKEGDTHMAKAKNKETSKKHYIVRDTHYGLIGDNFTDLDDAKEAAAKQFKTKRSSTASSILSRDIVVYESIAVIKEPVPQVDWVDIT